MRRPRKSPMTKQKSIDNFYNPRQTLRGALIERDVVWPRIHPPKKSGEFSKKDLMAKTIDIDKLEELMDKYGRKGNKHYSEEKLRHFRLFSRKVRKVRKVQKKNKKTY